MVDVKVNIVESPREGREMARYGVIIEGPTQQHEMTVFACGWDHAAEAAIEKIKDKIQERRFKGWGPVEGPWTVLSITLE